MWLGKLRWWCARPQSVGCASSMRGSGNSLGSAPGTQGAVRFFPGNAPSLLCLPLACVCAQRARLWLRRAGRCTPFPGDRAGGARAAQELWATRHRVRVHGVRHRSELCARPGGGSASSPGVGHDQRAGAGAALEALRPLRIGLSGQAVHGQSLRFLNAWSACGEHPSLA